MKSTFYSIFLVFLIISCAAVPDADQVILKKNEQLVRAYFEEVWNKGNLELLDSLMGPEYVNHTPSVSSGKNGVTELKTIVASFRSAFPDLHFKINDLVVTKTKVAARVQMSGTQRDSLFDLPPTNRKVVVNQINIEEIRNGKLVDHWRVTDELGVMKQLGFLSFLEKTLARSE